MDAAALEARFTLMERRMAELERENQLLRASAPEPRQEARNGELLPRREVLKGAAYALGAVSLSLMGTQRAEATTGYMQYGANNDAGDYLTQLSSSSYKWTLELINDEPSTGRALYATSFGGYAVEAIVRGLNSFGNGVNVTVSGSAIEGRSVLGRGGVFRGKKAQIRLVASTATTKPATGSRGDLFVDSSGRLWYCKTGGLTTGWKQLA